MAFRHYKTSSMFDQILQLVKEHLNSNPELTGNMTAEQADQVHREIATHITNGLQAQTPAADTGAGILSQLENNLASGSIPTSAISGALIGSLASKFGMSPLITGAIAAALPGLMQKFMQRNSAEPAVAPKV
jgi:hypothetical protein